MKDIIVSTWGIGPSYRRRVKYNIRKAIMSGYDILPYIILTDDVSDFDDLRKETDKIIDVLDINTLRNKLSQWSFEYEYVSDKKIESEYAQDFRNNSNNKKHFSYALHRFSLPTIYELGYNKFLLCDSDTDIRYDKIISGEVTETEFWDQYDTPINTMKGCDLQRFFLDPNHDWNTINVIFGDVLRYALSERYPKYQDRITLFNREHIQTEGPFRFYHFNNTDMILEYFEMWDEAMKISLTNKDMRIQLNPGYYMYIDNTPVTIVNEILNITPLNFDHKWYTVNIYKGDRYFFPIGWQYTINGKNLSLQPSNNYEEFCEINKELIEALKLINEWPE